MKRKLSSFDIYVIVSELQDLKDSYIDNIYQLTRDEFLIKIKNINTKQKDNIFIRNGKLICTTLKQFETPAKPTTFAMTLRKYLLNGTITGITQHEFDRIIKLKISRKDGDYILVFEFFSDGNIILVNPEGKIILPLIKQHWAHRSIVGNVQYVPPPIQTNPFSLTKEKFKDLMKESKADLVRTLAVNVNLSGSIAEEICKRVHIDKTLKIRDIDDKKIEKIFTILSNFLDLFKNNKFEPVFIKKDNNIIDILPFRFEIFEKMHFERTEKFAKGLEIFIDVKEPEKKIISDIEKKKDKLNRQLLQQQETVVELNKKIGQKKFEGDLIYLNYQPLENLLNMITESLVYKEKEEKIKEINEKDIVKEFDPIDNLLIVNLKDSKGKNYEVGIDFRETVAENAEKAYDENKRLRKKLEGAEKSIDETKRLIELIKKKGQIEKENEKKVEKNEKILWFERFRWFISSDGNIVICGKDEKSNDLVVKKYLGDGDRYAHADIQGASSCIIKSKNVNDENLEISEKTLEEACIFAASFSKAWKQFAGASAYWVLPEQVSKTPQSGEFVPRGAFIIRGKRNYVKCKLELAVGKIKINDEIKVMCGPIDAIKKYTDKYVVIEPGNIKKIDIAHKLSKIFEVHVDTIDRVLPSGNTIITKTVGLEVR